jgi:hypothetical protein
LRLVVVRVRSLLLVHWCVNLMIGGIY